MTQMTPSTTSRRLTIAFLGLTLLAPLTRAADPAPLPFTRQQDVVYGRKFGTALTLDVLTPTARPNGAAIILVISGGWYSSHDAIDGASRLFAAPLAQRGYTVFAVVHGSQPNWAQRFPT